MKTTVCAIVPAFNEEATIADVVQALRAVPLIDEVLVVSDGSSDRTVQTAHQAGARVIALEKNLGKGAAMRAGAAQTKADILFFADADLRGFTQEHVVGLLLPVLSGKAVMSVGLRDRGVWTGLSRLFPLVGGERAMKREVFGDIHPQYSSGYMVEIAMNEHCRLKGWRVAPVFLKGLSIRRKVDKVGWRRGIIGYCQMWYQVMKGMVVVKMAARNGEFLSKSESLSMKV